MNWLVAGSLFRLGSKSPRYASYGTRREVCYRRINFDLKIEVKFELTTENSTPKLIKYWNLVPRITTRFTVWIYI